MPVFQLPTHLFDEDEVSQVTRHPHPREAQAENLRLFMLKMERPPVRFKPGNLATERDGLGYFSDDPLLVFVRYLRPTRSDNDLRQHWFGKTMLDVYDCVVARTNYEGTAIMGLHDSRRLERWAP